MADSKQTLQQFRSHILKQNVLKSGLFGLLIGLCASFTSALVSWFFGYDGGLWLSIGILVGTTAVGSVILYFTKFRVTDSLMARRIDMLGLRERIVTMMELEKEESFMAKRQRADAEEKLKTVSPKQLKFRMARKAIACIATAAVIAPAMMVICELAALGILNSGLEIINPNANVSEIEVVYEFEGGGWIDGEEIQTLTVGQDATPVMAVADEGWVFVCWDDGGYEPYRHDKGLTESKTFVAIFEEIEDEADKEGNGNGSGQGSGQGEGDGAGDMPGDGEGQGNGNGSGQGQGKGEGEGQGEGQGEGAGGKHSESNVIIDGKTDYGDVFSDFFDAAMDSLTEGDGSSTEGDVVGNYFEGLS